MSCTFLNSKFVFTLWFSLVFAGLPAPVSLFYLFRKKIFNQIYPCLACLACIWTILKLLVTLRILKNYFSKTLTLQHVCVLSVDPCLLVLSSADNNSHMFVNLSCFLMCQWWAKVNSCLSWTEISFKGHEMGGKPQHEKHKQSWKCWLNGKTKGQVH